MTPRLERRAPAHHQRLTALIQTRLTILQARLALHAPPQPPNSPMPNHLIASPIEPVTAVPAGYSRRAERERPDYPPPTSQSPGQQHRLQPIHLPPPVARGSRSPRMEMGGRQLPGLPGLHSLRAPGERRLSPTKLEHQGAGGRSANGLDMLLDVGMGRVAENGRA